MYSFVIIFSNVFPINVYEKCLFLLDAWIWSYIYLYVNSYSIDNCKTFEDKLMCI